MRIFLLGFMGCGKSSIGKQLAKKINFKFIDLDLYIEKKCNYSITEIFNNKGEEKFREIEHDCLKEVLKLNNIILATGGGTPCFYDNIKLMNDNGITIYLQINIECLVKRLAFQKNKRPLIRDVPTKELKNYVKNNLREREAYYSQAHHTVNAENLNINNLIYYCK